jgi:hypothetical protein
VVGAHPTLIHTRKRHLLAGVEQGFAGGFVYLAATIDWYKRYAVTRRLSNTLDGAFCRDMLEMALSGCTSRSATGPWPKCTATEAEGRRGLAKVRRPLV